MNNGLDRAKFKFEKKLEAYIEKNRLLHGSDTVLVALSGGADSVCLAKVLCNLSGKYSLNIIAAHVNHMIRDKEADRDEEFCKKFCKELGLKLEILKVNVPEIAKKEKKSLELAAREVRYKFFAKLCEKYGINKVATAHNKNDNAETIVMNYMRGSGTGGLCGIDAKRANIIRPLLCMEKKEILDYIKRCGLEFVTDSTNLSCDYTRNKIRLEMIPYIENNFNPNFTEVITNAAETIKADNDFLEEEAERIKDNYIKTEKDRVFIELEEFKKLHKAMRYRIIRKAVCLLKGDVSDIGFDAVKRIDELEKGKADICSGIYANVSYKRLYFEREYEKKDYQYDLLPGKTVYIAEDESCVSCEIIDKSEIKKEKNCVYFDFDKLKNLTVRNRKDGDFIKTEAGRKKIKNLFIDEKIPVFERDSIPIVTSGEDIIWICSVRRCSEFKIDEKTKKAVKIKYMKE